jgi:hypothetical protein
MSLIPQIATVAEVVDLLVNRNMVLYAPTKALGEHAAEIAALDVSYFEYETTADIYHEILGGIRNEDTRFAQLREAYIQEKDCEPTWCIFAASNAEVLKYEVMSRSDIEDPDDEDWDDPDDDEDDGPKPMDKKLASMLLKAMEYRESSYDKAAADAETAKMEAGATADPDHAWLYVVDYAEFYGLTLKQAAEKAAVEAGEPTMATIIFYLLVYSWNDVQVWIKEHKLV